MSSGPGAVRRRQTQIISGYRRTEQQGFTLLEIMLVILLMALISVGPLLMISWGSGSRQLQRESETLLGRLKLAHEEAVLGSQELGLWLEEERYGFVLLGEKAPDPQQASLAAAGDNQPLPRQWQWQKLERAPFIEHTLPEPLRLELTLDGLSAERFDTSLFDDDPEMRIPQVLLLSSGEITAFELRIYDDNQPEQQRWITGQPSGRLLLRSSDDDEDGS